MQQSRSQILVSDSHSHQIHPKPVAYLTLQKNNNNNSKKKMKTRSEQGDVAPEKKEYQQVPHPRSF